MQLTEENLRLVEDLLEYRFKNRALLIQAFTHRSYAYEQSPRPADNERLELLGDAVLDLVVTAWLLKAFPREGEGNLSKLRASLVNARHLMVVADTLGMPELLQVGRSYTNDLRTPQRMSVMANAVEAVFGAIFLDADFVTAERVVHLLLRDGLERVQASGRGLVQDHKTVLQELTVKRFGCLPEYRLLEEVGTVQERTYRMAVLIRGEELSVREAHSKKEATQLAAADALELLEAGWEVKPA